MRWRSARVSIWVDSEPLYRDVFMNGKKEKTQICLLRPWKALVALQYFATQAKYYEKKPNMELIQLYLQLSRNLIFSFALLAQNLAKWQSHISLRKSLLCDACGPIIWGLTEITLMHLKMKFDPIRNYETLGCSWARWYVVNNRCLSYKS